MTTQNLDALIRQWIAEICEVDLKAIRPEAKLTAYGLDSVRAIELITRIEEHSGCVIEEGELSEVRTLGDLLKALQDKID